MKQAILIIGLASRKTIKSLDVPTDFPSDLSLMKFLLDNGITIASSCGGVGSCKKCIVNGDLISCQITLKDFINYKEISAVEVSYL